MNGLFFGLTTIDIQYFVDRFPESNSKVKTNESPDILSGGPATNAAITFSFLGGNSHLVSVFGQNSFSDWLKKNMNSNEINYYDLASDIKIEPVVASVITSGDNGDRTIFTNNPADINLNTCTDKLFGANDFKIILVDGFYLSKATEIAKEGKRRGVPVVFDGGSWKPGLEKLLPFVDYAICSEKFLPPGCDNTTDVIKYLRESDIPCSAITRGGKPLIYIEGDVVRELNVPAITPVDTLGAGDIFHGAFSYYVLKESSLAAALEKSAYVAARSCLHPGTRIWMQKMAI